ncbi:MAG TPA: hypothetical protein VMZ91_10170 [Candidatus Paceibacterota bacterium]|nr:hypothetical protein [Candidatus Paceibacterota bacterium]
MDKDDLIQLQSEEYEVDELIESNVEYMKIEYEENLILLENLFKEVVSQIEEKKPNLIKLKGMLTK